ncbi:endo-beta-glucanase [Rickenella mellea]|uniref:Endo-beta-glucanase n=1 Tax=Rickenella mellea TaxID=50990 RepID=A0A4Y7Q0E9_9AGAM|nr:endo-beta-glucanase [Rickenella mellea]
MIHFVLLLVSIYSVANLFPSCLAGHYNAADTYVGKDFLTGFTHFSDPDPTHGRVNYVDQATALRLNLTVATADSLIMRADYTTNLTSKDPGRNAVRIESVKSYTTHVIIFDINHMPQGCATWPAAWEVGGKWPDEGEVDILEGVNDNIPNQSTLHTNAGCTMPSTRQQTGTSTGTDCNVATTGNSGCGVVSNKPNIYGKAFNSNGGGWYAMERTSTFINVYFWARNDASVPTDVKTGGNTVDTSAWGTPVANFPNTSCDFASHFKAHKIIINLTFCGDWAGSSFATAEVCPRIGSCDDYVDKNPGAFQNAYWDIASVRTYT